jgi:hypothetical protein
MYQKGDLYIFDGHDIETCEHPFRCSDISDARAEDSIADVPLGTVYLPHSCGEWVIGGREQIKALIADLEAIVAS